MKKFIILLILPILFLCGCEKEKVTEVKKEKKVIEKEIGSEVKYTDLNNTPVAIYRLNGNSLIKLTEDEYTFSSLQDIGIFQIYPSNEERIDLNNSFGTSFYEEFKKYNTNNNLKIGFNIKYDLTTGEHLSYNVLSPKNNFDHCEYLMNYLYDDYANSGKSFYSHIEENEYNENTLFTSIKLQSSGEIDKVKDKIELTVFTYDSEDDFLDNEYRGNSKYTYTIKRK